MIQQAIDMEPVIPLMARASITTEGGGGAIIEGIFGLFGEMSSWREKEKK